jgi:phosphohistidine swiveling domain-containing protein
MARDFNLKHWQPWGQQAAPLFLIMTLNPSMRPLREFLGSPLFTSIILFEGGQGTWLFRPDEARQLGQKMIDFLLCPQYRVAFETGAETARVSLLRKAKEIQFDSGLTKRETADLAQLFAELREAFYSYYRFAAFIEPVQFQGQEILAGFLRELAGDQAEADLAEAERTLFTLTTESFAVAILDDLRECAIALRSFIEDSKLKQQIDAIKRDAAFSELATGLVLASVRDTSQPQAAVLRERLARHSQAFYWKRNNYYATTFISEDDVLRELFATEGFDSENPASPFVQAVSEIRKHRTEQIERRRQLLSEWPAYYQNVAALMDTVGGAMVDERKRVVMVSNSAFDRILGEIATRTGSDIADCRLLIPQEIKSFVASPKEYQARFAERRRSFLVYQSDFALVDELIPELISAVEAAGMRVHVDMDDPYIAEGHDVDRVLQQLSARLNLLADTGPTANVLRGIPAYFDPVRPQISGRVRVIRDTKTERLEAGEILVAPSTTPDYMDAITRCIAIVTDWGGHTSHAAITARELKKPCLIGTNYASQVLRNGQEIRIRFDEGTVELL